MVNKYTTWIPKRKKEKKTFVIFRALFSFGRTSLCISTCLFAFFPTQHRPMKRAHIKWYIHTHTLRRHATNVSRVWSCKFSQACMQCAPKFIFVFLCSFQEKPKIDVVVVILLVYFHFTGWLCKDKWILHRFFFKISCKFQSHFATYYNNCPLIHYGFKRFHTAKSLSFISHRAFLFQLKNVSTEWV